MLVKLHNLFYSHTEHWHITFVNHMVIIYVGKTMLFLNLLCFSILFDSYLYGCCCCSCVLVIIVVLVLLSDSFSMLFPKFFLIELLFIKEMIMRCCHIRIFDGFFMLCLLISFFLVWVVVVAVAFFLFCSPLSHSVCVFNSSYSLSLLWRFVWIYYFVYFLTKQMKLNSD